MAASKTNNRTVACWIGAKTQISVKPKRESEFTTPIFVNADAKCVQFIESALCKVHDPKTGEMKATFNMSIDLPIAWLKDHTITGERGSAYAGETVKILDLRNPDIWTSFLNSIERTERGATSEAHQAAMNAVTAKWGLTTTTTTDDIL